MYIDVKNLRIGMGVYTYIRNKNTHIGVSVYVCMYAYEKYIYKYVSIRNAIFVIRGGCE